MDFIPSRHLNAKWLPEDRLFSSMDVWQYIMMTVTQWTHTHMQRLQCSPSSCKKKKKKRVWHPVIQINHLQPKETGNMLTGLWMSFRLDRATVAWFSRRKVDDRQCQQICVFTFSVATNEANAAFGSCTEGLPINQLSVFGRTLMQMLASRWNL